MISRRELNLALLGLAGASAAGIDTAAAQTAWPARPVTFIVPFGAGGGTDIIARTVSDDLTKVLNVSIVIDPRPGANGAIGSTVVARATPDGYTFLFTGSSTYSLNPNLMKDLTYDQLKELVPVATIGRSPWMLTVPVDSQFKTAAEVVAYGKANPGKLVFPFWQSSVLVTGEMFGSITGIQMRRVPYKGQTEVTTDFLAGRLPVYFCDIVGARPQIDAGKMRVLCSFTEKRSGLFPDVPTAREVGIDVVTDSMLAVFAPVGVPKPIMERMNAEISKIVNTSVSVRDRLTQIGVDPAPMNLADAETFVRTELKRWADMIAVAGLQKN
jgi:tripartite-type tricarboxylate transporter receptor subunit TctC